MFWKGFQWLAEYMDPSTMFGFEFCSFYVKLKSQSIVLSNHMSGNVALLFMNHILVFQKHEKISFFKIHSHMLNAGIKSLG